MMLVQSLTLGALKSHCYLVTDEETGDCAVIDPGYDKPELREAIRPIHAHIRLILLTHRHFDHISGVSAVLDECRDTAPRPAVYIHALDACGLEDPNESLLEQSGEDKAAIPPDVSPILLHDGEEIPLGASHFQVLHTPGHSAGCVCFLSGDLLFTGDTLFAGDCGRVDLPTGSAEDMARSLRRLADLPGDYRVLPGHGWESTLSAERQNNEQIHIAQCN